VSPVHDLATTLSKFLLLGLPLEDVIAMATTAPSTALGPAVRPRRAGHRREADVTILRSRRAGST
jgi:predicted amidohydrolase